MALFSLELEAGAEKLLAAYAAQKKRIVTAESCTGGLVAALLTSISGSSAVFERGFVTYSNEAKAEALDVPHDLLARFGAVSVEAAEAMATGALRHSRADIAVSITGIAGPGGGSEQKPVGLVYFGCGGQGKISTLEKRFGAIGRNEIRQASLRLALELLLDAISAA
jgi:nicotinamide-nucleotide amidase